MNLQNNTTAVIWAVVLTIVATMALSVVILVFAPDQEKDVAILIGFAAPTIAALLNVARTEYVAQKVDGHLETHVVQAVQSDKTAAQSALTAETAIQTNRAVVETNKAVVETLANLTADKKPNGEAPSG